MTTGKEPFDDQTSEWAADDAVSHPPTIPNPLPPPTATMPRIDLPDAEPATLSAHDATVPPAAPPAVALAPAKRRGTLRAGLVGGLVGAVVAGGVAFGTVKATDNSASSVVAPPAAALATPSTGAASALAGAFDVHAVLSKVGNAVVAIEVGQQRGQNIYGTGAGSGFIISDDGYVITNNHVVEGADAITVKFADGTDEPATVVGTSPTHDVAVVKIKDIHGATPLQLADSSTLRVGDSVLAIGNALDLGDSPTVTLGIVSAKDRSIDTQGENGATEHLTGLIQTDAAINPGNSGGPLVNAAGQVVGINSAGVPGANNIGFAIDINGVKDVINQLEQGKDVSASDPFLGVATVSVSDLDESGRQQFNVKATSGAVVEEVVPGAAADKAGLKIGDVIVKVDGKDIKTSDDLRSALQAKKPGDTMTVVVNRAGTTQTITVTVGSRSAQTS
jgi:S1-C subfamily serine protease